MATATKVSTRFPAGSTVKGAPSRFTCQSCTNAFASAKPQDPELPAGTGTCAACRSGVAADWAESKGVTLSVAITRFTRFA